VALLGHKGCLAFLPLHFSRQQEVLLALLVKMALQVLPVLLGTLVQSGQQVQRESKERLGQREREDKREPLGLRVKPARKGRVVLRELMEALVQRDRKEKRALQGQQAHKAKQAQRVQLARRDHKDRRGRRVCLE